MLGLLVAMLSATAAAYAVGSGKNKAKKKRVSWNLESNFLHESRD